MQHRIAVTLAAALVSMSAASALSAQSQTDSDARAAMEAAIVHLSPYELHSPVEEYQCRNFEIFHALGEEACVGGRVARCELQVNTMNWRRSQVPCDSPPQPSQ